MEFIEEGGRPMGLTVSIETPEAVRIPHVDTARLPSFTLSLPFLFCHNTLPSAVQLNATASIVLLPLSTIRSCLPPLYFVFLLHFHTGTITLTTRKDYASINIHAHLS
jgi:hypothetical protein